MSTVGVGYEGSVKEEDSELQLLGRVVDRSSEGSSSNAGRNKRNLK